MDLSLSLPPSYPPQLAQPHTHLYGLATIRLALRCRPAQLHPPQRVEDGARAPGLPHDSGALSEPDQAWVVRVDVQRTQLLGDLEEWVDAEGGVNGLFV